MLVPELQCSRSTDRDGSRLLASLLTHSPTKHIAMAHDESYTPAPAPAPDKASSYGGLLHSTARSSYCSCKHDCSDIFVFVSLCPPRLHLPTYRNRIGSASPSIYDLSQQLAVLIRLCARRH